MYLYKCEEHQIHLKACHFNGKLFIKIQNILRVIEIDLEVYRPDQNRIYCGEKDW